MPEKPEAKEPREISGNGPTNTAMRAPGNWHSDPTCQVSIIVNQASGLGLQLLCSTCLCVCDLEAVAHREVWGASFHGGRGKAR